jgi:hypothetical protein
VKIIEKVRLKMPKNLDNYLAGDQNIVDIVRGFAQ